MLIRSGVTSFRVPAGNQKQGLCAGTFEDFRLSRFLIEAAVISPVSLGIEQR